MRPSPGVRGQGNYRPQAGQQPRVIGASNNYGPRVGQQSRNNFSRSEFSGAAHNTAYFVHDHAMNNVDSVCNDVAYGTTVDNVNCGRPSGSDISDSEFIVKPLFINNLRTQGIRDSGCRPVLVSKDLISPEDFIPGKYSVLQGVFDADENKVHMLPVARIKIRSPLFNCNKNLTIEAVVCTLPKGISCIIGNSLFRHRTELSDVIAVRRPSGLITKMENGGFQRPWVSERRSHNESSDSQTNDGHTRSAVSYTHLTLPTKRIV